MTTFIDRLCKLIESGPAVRMLRDGGVSWDDIATKFRKRCNPLGLSARQLRRIYEEDRQGLDKLRRIAKRC